MEYYKKSGLIILRIGIAFSFIYAAISAFLNPNAWIGFVPSFIEIFVSREMFLNIHIIFDLILGLWLLSGWKTFYAVVVSCLVLIGIIIFNLASLDIIFRDITILLAAVALGILSYEKN